MRKVWWREINSKNSREKWKKKFSRNWNSIAPKVEVVRSLEISARNSINSKRVIYACFGWKQNLRWSTSRSVRSPISSIIFCWAGTGKNRKCERYAIITRLAINNFEDFYRCLAWFNQAQWGLQNWINVSLSNWLQRKTLNKITLRNLITIIKAFQRNIFLFLNG